MHTMLLRALRIIVAAGLPVSFLAATVDLRHINTTTVSLVLVMVVFCIALLWGSLEALVAAVAAGLGLDYFFLPPRGFGILETEHIVAFVVFFVTAIATGQLSARANRHKDEAVRRQTGSRT